MRARQREPRIANPDTHPRKLVGLVVAAEFLECDRKTLNKYLRERLIAYEDRGARRKIAVTELVAFQRRQHRSVFHEKRETGE